MINNNLDYEKNSNTTLKSSTTTSKTDNAIQSNSNNRKSSTSSTTTTTTTTAEATTTNNTNDNSYFNRFDNRIAANLAAVINGARFRSSSCSKTANKSFSNNTSINTKSTGCTNNSNFISSLRSNANNFISNSSTNLHVNNIDGFGGGIGGRQQHQEHHYNGVTTLGGGTSNRQQHVPPMHLQLNNVTGYGNGSRLGSPLLLSNRIDGYGSAGSMGRRRPTHLFSQINLNCNDNEKVAQTPSSDEDNSPTELNNCKRLADKPPLVKRLTMGLLRTHEESRPLVNNATPTSTANVITSTNGTLKSNISTLAGNHAVYSNGYINEEAFEPEKFIASKFGDSCRQSLTAIPMLDTMNFNDNSEFNLKKRYLRETSSANSSPKIFANRLRTNAANAAGHHYSSTVTTNSGNGYNTINSSLAFTTDDDDDSDLKDACWFQAGISREIAVEVLSSKSPGAFLVRKSSSKPGCYALTLRVPSTPGPKIANYIILRTARGYKIKGFRKEFTTLKALITHHSVMPELLPIPLAMPRPANMTSSRRNLDDFDTYDSLQMLMKYLRAKNLENAE